MVLSTYFTDFLKEIRLTDAQTNDLITGHTTLSKRLNEYDDLKDIIVGMFLQGSYKRSTAVRPKGDSRSDVDLVVVTNIDKDKTTPEEVLNLFLPFMDKYYEGKYRKQNKSIGIELSYVDLDVVITSAPSEAEKDIINESFFKSTNELSEIEDKDTSDWKSEALFIPNFNTGEWEETDPIAQIKKTIEKNMSCNGYYVNVVKALKWWKKNVDVENNPPKSYPLEHLICMSCPDDINSVSEGVVLSLEYIVNNYQTKPFMSDHGVPTHDVFERITEEDYQDFYELAKEAATIARLAYGSNDKDESIKEWKKLFGYKFPSNKDTKDACFSERSSITKVAPERYA